MATYNEAIFEEDFSCPVCFEELLSPIFQCNHGHLICQKCVEKSKLCPTCRTELPPQKCRNLGVEKLIRLLVSPCPYASAGCQELHRGEGMRKHKKSCHFGPERVCRILGFHDCVMDVPASELPVHLEEAHNMAGVFCKEGDSIEVEQSGLTSEQLESGHVGWTPTFIVQGGQTYFFRTKVDSKTISWVVSTTSGSNLHDVLAEISLSDDRKDSSLTWSGTVGELKLDWDVSKSFAYPKEFIAGLTRWTLRMFLSSKKVDGKISEVGQLDRKDNEVSQVHKVTSGRRTLVQLIPVPMEVDWTKVDTPQVQVISALSAVLCLQMDKTKIIAGTAMGRIGIWDRKTLNRVRVLKHASGRVNCLHFNDQALVSGGSNGHIYIWNLGTGDKLFAIKVGAAVLAIKIFQSTLVSLDSGNSLRLYSLASCEEQGRLGCNSYSPVDLNDKYLVYQEVAPPSRVRSRALQNSSLWSGSDGRAERVWNLVYQEVAPPSQVNTGISVYDLKEKTTEVLQGNTTRVRSLALQNSILLSGSDDKAVRVWDLELGGCLRILPGHQSYVSFLICEGEQFLSRDNNGEIRVWNLKEAVNATRRDSDLCLKTGVTKMDQFNCIFFQLENFRIVTGHQDGSIRIMNFDKR